MLCPLQILCSSVLHYIALYSCSEQQDKVETFPKQVFKNLSGPGSPWIQTSYRIHLPAACSVVPSTEASYLPGPTAASSPLFLPLVHLHNKCIVLVTVGQLTVPPNHKFQWMLTEYPLSMIYLLKWLCSISYHGIYTTVSICTTHNHTMKIMTEYM